MPQNHSWFGKFANAFRGLAVGVVGQNSFLVHGFAAAAVAVLAAWLQVSSAEWCLLLMAIGMVVTSEYFNSSLEHLAQAITKDHDSHIGAALDIASGAVLFASAIASLIGCVVFLPYLWRLFFSGG